MIAIVDYGVGNLFSLQGSLTYLGLPSQITSKAEEIIKASHVILPGVGAFGDAARKLSALGLDAAVLEAAAKGKPLLGICLGMQLLFETGLEYGKHKGLGLLPGVVAPMEKDLPIPLRLPHIGWNSLQIRKETPLASSQLEGEFVYYVHSYYAKTDSEVILAESEYGVMVPGVVGVGNVYGCQFHPEKSGEVGLRILKNFAKLGGKVEV